MKWQAVYYHYRKWCTTNVLKNSWIGVLEKNKSKFGLSSVDLMVAILLQSEVAKKRKTINALYLNDRQGLPLAISNSVPGNHNDLYDIEVQFEIVTGTLEQANIQVEGLF